MRIRLLFSIKTVNIFSRFGKSTFHVWFWITYLSIAELVEGSECPPVSFRRHNCLFLCVSCVSSHSLLCWLLDSCSFAYSEISPLDSYDSSQPQYLFLHPCIFSSDYCSFETLPFKFLYLIFNFQPIYRNCLSHYSVTTRAPRLIHSFAMFSNAFYLEEAVEAEHIVCTQIEPPVKQQRSASEQMGTASSIESVSALQMRRKSQSIIGMKKKLGPKRSCPEYMTEYDVKMLMKKYDINRNRHDSDDQVILKE